MHSSCIGTGFLNLSWAVDSDWRNEIADRRGFNEFSPQVLDSPLEKWYEIQSFRRYLEYCSCFPTSRGASWGDSGIWSGGPRADQEQQWGDTTLLLALWWRGSRKNRKRLKVQVAFSPLSLRAPSLKTWQYFARFWMSQTEDQERIVVMKYTGKPLGGAEVQVCSCSALPAHLELLLLLHTVGQDVSVFGARTGVSAALLRSCSLISPVYLTLFSQQAVANSRRHRWVPP